MSSIAIDGGWPKAETISPLIAKKRRFCMVRNEGERLKRVVVCTPRKEYAHGSNCVRHNIGELSDPKRAIEQHDRLKLKLRACGAEVIDIPELKRHPNSVFTRDTALCTPQGYVKLRLGLHSRLGEEEWMAESLEAIGESFVREIKAPGAVEGGDVLLAGEVAFIRFILIGLTRKNMRKSRQDFYRA